MFKKYSKAVNFYHCALVVLTLFLAGCASGGTKKQPVSTGSSDSSKGIVLESVNVVGNGDAVLVEASGVINFTSDKTDSPPVVVIDLPDVDVTGLSSPIVVNNSFITEIVLTQNDGIGKIEVGLQDGVGHEIKAGEDSLLLDLRKDSNVAINTGDMQSDEVMESEGGEEEPVFVDDSVGEDIFETEDTEEVMVDVDSDAQAEANKIIAETFDPATKLTGVDKEKSGGVTKVIIEADGSVNNYNSFTLLSPARLVVDVSGVKNEIKKKSYSVKGNDVDKVRVGTHSNKIRFVFDSSASEIGNYKVEKVGKTLVVMFMEEGATVPVSREVEPEVEMVSDAEETMDETIDIEEVESGRTPEPVAKVEVEEEKKAGSKIRDISFDVTEGVATLKIKRSSKENYKPSESLDGKTILINIENTEVPEKLRMIMDARQLGTPVASISSYQGSHNNANLLIKLAAKTLYDITDDGSTILLDFILDSAGGITYTTGEGGAGGNIFGAPQISEDGRPKKVYTGRKIDLEMVDAEVVDVIDFIAEVSNFNIVTSGVTGKITLRLKNVPWDQAFDLILSTEGLDKLEEGNIIRVAPLEQIRKQKEAELASEAAGRKLEDLVTEFIRINYDDASSLIGQIKGLLSERGSVSAHKVTNTLIVKDIPKAIDDVKEFVGQIDLASPQVLIEARIVEASSNFARDLGVQWGFDTQSSTGPNVHQALFGGAVDGPPMNYNHFASADSPYTNANNPLPGILGTTNYAVALPASGGAGPLGGIGMVLGKSGTNPLALELRITAGEVEGSIKTISRPRIVTMDGKPAEITQGETIPFETTGTDGGITTKFINAGLGLRVTPHITPDGSIIMEIDAENNSLGSFTTTAGEPSINEKKARTEVLVKDGETTVIGGVIVTKESVSERGVPFLKDLPLIGWLFKSRSVTDTQSELLIFITPTIVRQSAS